jgi:hypothetical protein
MCPDSLNEDDTQVKGDGTENRLMNHLRSLENWYAAEFERHLKDLAEILNVELQSEVEEVRTEYEERYKGLHQKSAQLLQRPNSFREVSEEITRCEETVAQCASELERLVPDDSISLGKVLKIRAQQLETKAYIRGLKFLSGLDSKTSPQGSQQIK